jgi:hypothetical protein
MTALVHEFFNSMSDVRKALKISKMTNAVENQQQLRYQI